MLTYLLICLIDLNRDFPLLTQAYHDNPSIAFDADAVGALPVNAVQAKSVEAQYMIKFFDDYQFDYAINFHDGAQVVNYMAVYYLESYVYVFVSTSCF